MADWPLTFNAEAAAEPFFYAVDQNPPAQLFGLWGGIKHIGLSFQDSKLISSDIQGQILVPYFDQPVDVRLNIQPNGNPHRHAAQPGA